MSASLSTECLGGGTQVVQSRTQHTLMHLNSQSNAGVGLGHEAVSAKGATSRECHSAGPMWTMEW